MNSKYKPSFDPIQLEILTRLIKFQGLKFSLLKPEGIGNDSFNYHLKYLIQKGLVEKSNEGLYLLSVEGRKVIANFNIKGEIHQLFKASVALYVVNDLNADDPKILMQRRKRYPFFNDVNSIAGKILWGERVEDAAKRKLEEEAGLIADFRFMGIHRKTRLDNKGLILEDTLYHSCFAQGPKGSLIENNEFGDNFWVSISEARKYILKNIDCGNYDLLEYDAIEKQDFSIFYLHDIYEVSEY